MLTQTKIFPLPNQTHQSTEKRFIQLIKPTTNLLQQANSEQITLTLSPTGLFPAKTKKQSAQGETRGEHAQSG